MTFLYLYYYTFKGLYMCGQVAYIISYDIMIVSM